MLHTKQCKPQPVVLTQRTISPSRTKAETALISCAQSQSFPEEYQPLKLGKQIAPNSRLAPLSPEFDRALEILRGRLRESKDLEPDAIHPVVLDPKHPLTQLLMNQLSPTPVLRSQAPK